MTGIHDDEPEPCPRTWDNDRKTWSDDWKQFLNEYQWAEKKEEIQLGRQRIRDHVHKPETLADIAKFGIEDGAFAINAIAEIMH